MNDPFVHEQAAGFAGRLLSGRPDDPGRIALAFRTALGRLPTVEEDREVTEFLARYRDRLAARGVGGSALEAQCWSALARTLVARNEFLFVD
jgi:hypothetical protein